MFVRAFTVVVVGSLFVSVATAGPKQGLGHCKGNGVGHGHHDDDCADPTPTPTATGTAPTPTPTPAPTAPPAASGGIVWKDATGAVVPEIRTLQSQHFALLRLTYKDARGLLWDLDPWTLEVRTMSLGSSPTIQRLYTTTNCTGAAYFGPRAWLPRVVFRIDGETTYRAFPDSPTLVPITIRSYDGGSTQPCQPHPGSAVMAVPIEETVPADPITVPTLNYVPPLHPE
jgi:hypothetical protein